MQRTSLFLLVFFFLLAGQAHGSGRVVNGTVPNNPMDDWPYIVALVDKGSRSTFCTGTLIAPRWVLTAAHCIQSGSSSRTPSNTVVAIGQTSVRARTPVWALEKTIPHPRFSYNDESCILFVCWGEGFAESVQHDIGLLKLRRAASVRPAPLEGSGAEKKFNNYRYHSSYMMRSGCFPFCDNPAAGGRLRLLEIAGYGRQCYDCDGGLGRLLEGDIAVIPHRACEIGYPGFGARNILCMQHGGSKPSGPPNQICNGDSGGPAILQDYKAGREVIGRRLVIGVASFGACERNPDSGFFAVKPYYNWIQSQMRRQ